MKAKLLDDAPACYEVVLAGGGIYKKSLNYHSVANLIFFSSFGQFILNKVFLYEAILFSSGF